ncbi:MAG: farnesyl diphosphate synthase [Desulfatiglans sp.]|jgi:geranylgeranyl diphosphate synthase type II|nr:farnesyl diphosphate synthase [Thermodesulfobacteriota bacterium]MEE4353289.1 farnesyl diphosphate synthase [Desulfatiglans sp.]
MTYEPAFDLMNYLKEKKALVDRALEASFPEPEGLASDVIEAMRYSLFAGGKRLRPILCMAGADAVAGAGTTVLPVACALEAIHTYSLIHDDLPAMDDDDMRRGKPTNHAVFGEAVALLAGDGLLTEAFHMMSVPEFTERMPKDAIVKTIGLIASAAGYRGMVGGQTVDILSEAKEVGLPVVEYIHTHKTGALIEASVASGAILGGGNKEQVEAIGSYGRCIGLAFQIADDILDIEGDSKTLGKRVGADERKGKITYPAVVGLSRSKEIQSELVLSGIERLDKFDDKAEPLRQIARYIIERNK